MNEKEAKQLVLTSILVTGMVAVGRKAIEKREIPSMRILVGVLISGFLLSVLAQFAPELAGPLALLLMITAIFSSGNLLDKVAKIGKGR